MKLFTQMRHMRDEALAVLDRANTNLVEARAARETAEHTARRLRLSGHENHFREAVEFQLRGVHRA